MKRREPLCGEPPSATRGITAYEISACLVGSEMCIRDSSSPISDDPFSIAASQPTFGATAGAHTAFNSNSTSLEPLFGATTAAPTTFGSSATGDAVFGSNTFAPSFGANPALFAPAAVSNPFVAPAQPVMVLPQAAWASPVGTQGL